MDEPTTPRPMATDRRRRGKGERGLAMVMTGLLLVPLMVFAAFGVDLASWYARISEIQRAADAAALAGAVWMPEISTAQARAEDSLRSNGMHPDVDPAISFLIQQGSTAASLRVTVTDNDADRHFSSVFLSDDAVLSRYAEAEYNLPLPLGSPLHYFGGDSTRVPDPPPFNTGFTVNWPTDYTTRPPTDNSDSWPFGGSDPVTPVDLNCNVSNDALTGRWAGSPPTYRPSEFDPSNSTICGWGNSPGATSGTTAVPPPDYWYRAPNNAATGCRVREDGDPSDSVFGWWNGTQFNDAGSGPTRPPCVWNVVTSTDTSLFASHPNGANVVRTLAPQNRPCLVGYTAADGYWPGSGGWQNGQPGSIVGEQDSDGNRLCTWSAQVTFTQVDPPPAIDPGRSPGFWAAIEGPRTRAFQGDAYSTRCWTAANCNVVQNATYQQPGNANRGTWFVVEIPPGLTGSVALNVYDAGYTPGSTNNQAGDRTLDCSTGSGNCEDITTQYQVYQQTNVLDFNARSPLWTTGPDVADGSCNWQVGGTDLGGSDDAAFFGQWRNLCNLPSVTPGQKYLINVQTVGTSGNGVNGYALEAVANGSHSGTQPALYAYSHMTMQNNNTCGGSGPACPPPPATFYLAEVGQQYAGRTLVLDLWDAGDVSGNAHMTIMMPDATNPRPVNPVPASSCTYTATSSPNAPISGTTGTEVTTPVTPGGANCTIQSSSGSGAIYNGQWLRIRVQIPNGYTCTPLVNPETTGGSCWWGIRYNFSASANDVTTWAARIEGNPLQLTQ